MSLTIEKVFKGHYDSLKTNYGKEEDAVRRKKQVNTSSQFMELSKTNQIIRCLNYRDQTRTLRIRIDEKEQLKPLIENFVQVTTWWPH